MRLLAVVVAVLVPLPLTIERPAESAMITGLVSDPTTHAPLAGAIVAASPTDSAITDATGRYTLRTPSRDSATLSVRHAGYLGLIVPRLILRIDTLRFDVELHTNPATRMVANRTMAAPILLIRRSPDSLAATIDPDSSYFAKTRVDESSVYSVDVIKRNARMAPTYGAGATAGGMIRILLKRASAFPFADL